MFAIGFRIALEHLGAGDKDVGAGARQERRGLRRDAAVDLDVDLAGPDL